MKTNKKTQNGIKVMTGIRSGGLPTVNHSRRFAVKSGIKAGAGILHVNHNRIQKAKLETSTSTFRGALGVRSGLKAGAGILHVNHSRALAC